MTNAIKNGTIALDVDAIRSDFPVLGKTIHGKPLIYLDNGATTQKPQCVIDRIHQFESEEYSTVRRGAYKLCEESTRCYEETRKKVANFLGTPDEKEIIFTSGTTQSINLIAYSFAKAFIKPGDEIIISNIEHHANIVPWQVVCKEFGANLKVIPVNDSGELIIDEYEKLLSGKTRIVAVNHISNALGTINPIKKIAAKARSAGAKVLIDGAQSTPHLKINVTDLDCDFYTFSGHKMYGPSGVGGLYARMEMQEAMPPYVTGGDMIMKVTLEETTYAKPPAKFEAGTPPITQVIGLGAAIDYIKSIGLDKISTYEGQLLDYGTEKLKEVPGLRLIGTAKNKASILSFYLDAVHPHDIVTLLDQDGIQLRGGHHCAQPTMIRFGVPATARASISFYNTFQELDALAESLKKANELFSG